jgi:hypothetical protein
MTKSPTEIGYSLSVYDSSRGRTVDLTLPVTDTQRFLFNALQKDIQDGAVSARGHPATPERRSRAAEAHKRKTQLTATVLKTYQHLFKDGHHLFASEASANASATTTEGGGHAMDTTQ